jgi:hypothetical protein
MIERTIFTAAGNNLEELRSAIDAIETFTGEAHPSTIYVELLDTGGDHRWLHVVERELTDGSTVYNLLIAS